MTLFCETCSTYLGPNTPVCPQCGWTRPAHMRYPGRGKGVWQEPYRLEGYPIGRPVFSHGLILAAWKKGKTAGGLTALDRTGRLRWQIICQEAPLEGILLEGECVYFCTSGMLDACGVCSGAGKVVDISGACCPTLVDANGVCCQVGCSAAALGPGSNGCLFPSSCNRGGWC